MNEISEKIYQGEKYKNMYNAGVKQIREYETELEKFIKIKREDDNQINSLSNKAEILERQNKQLQE